MSDIYRYREFQIYKDSLELTKTIRDLTKGNFPVEEKFSLTSQIIRAADSVVLNIAEGSAKYSDLDFSRFLNQASGSLNEVVACLDIALLNNYINKDEMMKIINKSDNIYKQLLAFSSKVRKDHCNK